MLGVPKVWLGFSFFYFRAFLSHVRSPLVSLGVPKVGLGFSV